MSRIYFRFFLFIKPYRPTPAIPEPRRASVAGSGTLVVLQSLLSTSNLSLSYPPLAPMAYADCNGIPISANKNKPSIRLLAKYFFMGISPFCVIDLRHLDARKRLHARLWLILMLLINYNFFTNLPYYCRYYKNYCKNPSILFGQNIFYLFFKNYHREHVKSSTLY